MEKNNALAKLFAKLGLLTIICGFAATPALASTPVRFRLLQNQPIVPVMINGAGPFDLIFDTGSSSTVIDPELARQLSLTPLESSYVLTVAGSKTVPRYRLDTMALGPKSVRNLAALCAEMRGLHAISSKIRGLIGQDFLSGFDYILNYRDQRIEFEDDVEFVNKLLGKRLSVERNRRRLLITTHPSSPQKQASKLVMDSGTSSLVVFREASRNWDLDIEMDENGGFSASTIVGSQTLSTGRLCKLRIGDETFSDLPVRVVDGRAVIEGRPENGLLPTSLFRSIYFNNTHNFVILNPRLPNQQSISANSAKPRDKP